MIQITFFRNSKTQLIYGYCLQGHADYEEEGKDIICSAVSALSINTANAIETLCRYKAEESTEDGYLKVIFPSLALSQVDFSDANIIRADALMNALLLGINSIQQQYGKKYLSFCEKTTN